MLKVETQYPASIPQTAVSGFAPLGLAWHWTAGAKGRAGAESTVRHFQATRYIVNASYSILAWHEHRVDLACTTVAWWIVPATKASHSMNPAAAFVPKTGSATEKARFAEVHRILARDSDPNADVWSISYCGMPADLASDLKCLTFRNDLRALARQLIAHPTFIAERPHFGHGWIQPTTRYEMDQVGFDFISMLYQPQEGATAPAAPVQEDDMTYLDTLVPIINRRVTIGKGATARTSPAWDASDPDANAITVHAADTTRTAVAWVTGTKLIGLKGEVYSADPTWLITDRYAKPGVTYYHKQDVISLEPVEATGVTPEQLAQAKRLEFGRGRDEGIAAYTAGGVKAAKAVMP